MKVFIIHKKTLIAFALIVCFTLVFAVALTQLVPAASQASAQPKEVPIYNVDKSEKIVSLSFDAAWGNEDTQKLIDTLNKYKVHATFFVVGQWVDKYPESVKALSSNGNEVMNHSNTHPHMTKLSKEDMIKQVNECDAKIEKITGKKPTLFRAPYGDYDNNLLDSLQSINHYCIQWDVDSLNLK